ncbi:MAG: adenylate kinase [Mycoplasmataceae bacterium]|jgi:adenylate kinase|nr:adenylate kinase [Mycoplasmataceae bacterium]
MILLLLGAPGSGKGTISSILISKHGFRQISTGDLLREEVASGSALGKQIDEIMKSGKFVSADLVNNLVKERITQYEQQKKSIVLDGYPRNVEQANFLAKYVNIDKVVELHVDQETLLKRLGGRLICPICNKAYNINTTSEYAPKKVDDKYMCDKCDVELFQRKDDNIETIKKRLEVYEEQTLPLVKYYSDRDLLVRIDATNNTESLVKTILS